MTPVPCNHLNTPGMKTPAFLTVSGSSGRQPQTQSWRSDLIGAEAQPAMKNVRNLQKRPARPGIGTAPVPHPRRVELRHWLPPGRPRVVAPTLKASGRRWVNLRRSFHPGSFSQKVSAGLDADRRAAFTFWSKQGPPQLQRTPQSEPDVGLHQENWVR